jgi:hypothetical protein
MAKRAVKEATTFEKKEIWGRRIGEGLETGGERKLCRMPILRSDQGFASGE